MTRWLRFTIAAALLLLLPTVFGFAAQPVRAAVHRPSPPVPRGRLRIIGTNRDGGRVEAAGLSWSPGALPSGDRLLSFEVAYKWQACATERAHCVAGADSTATPYAAENYVVGQRDTGRFLRLTETATEVVETDATDFDQGPVSTTRTVTDATPVAAYRPDQPPRTEFVNGTPEKRTGSREEYFEVDPPHFAAAEGAPSLEYRVDGRPWEAIGRGNVFYTGQLSLGRHDVQVRTSDAAGTSTVSYSWTVVPLPPPASCRPRPQRPCWYPPHLARNGRPMRWDWQIGAVRPVERTGRSAVDIYDVDGFLTTAAEVREMRTTWQAATLPHPRAVCYLDVAWENYRPDASPLRYGGRFPADTLGKVYYGYPAERWLDFRQLDALKPMLEERVGMCARKGFDAVEIDDIDSFDPPSTTGFHLTPGDAENFLAYLFNLVHRDGMTALWKNSPLLSWWGRRYTDGAVVEECYVGHDCFASEMAGQSQYGITCTELSGPTPCGWDDFTTDTSPRQPTGKWVGEAEYLQDHFVCAPTASRCAHLHGRKSFAAFCDAVYRPRDGFSAVLFTVDLDATVFDACPAGH